MNAKKQPKMARRSRFLNGFLTLINRYRLPLKAYDNYSTHKRFCQDRFMRFMEIVDFLLDYGKIKLRKIIDEK